MKYLKMISCAEFQIKLTIVHLLHRHFLCYQSSNSGSWATVVGTGVVVVERVFLLLTMYWTASNISSLLTPRSHIHWQRIWDSFVGDLIVRMVVLRLSSKSESLSFSPFFLFSSSAVVLLICYFFCYLIHFRFLPHFC